LYFSLKQTYLQLCLCCCPVLLQWWWKHIQWKRKWNKTGKTVNQFIHTISHSRKKLCKLQQGKSRHFHSPMSAHSVCNNQDQINPWFSEVCSELLDQWKQLRLQWLQDWSQITGDNRTMQDVWKTKLRSLQPTVWTTLDLSRGINKFKEGYQPVTKLDEDDDLLVDSYNNLLKWNNYFS
jgi:hypothetical protein